MLKIKDNVDLKELEKYGWELDTIDCFTSCEDCNIEHCLIKDEQHYCKSICEILHYTTIYASKRRREIYGVFDEYRTIRSDNKSYKYIEMACEKELKDGIVEKAESDE